MSCRRWHSCGISFARLTRSIGLQCDQPFYFYSNNCVRDTKVLYFTVEACWTIILLSTTTLFAAIKISCRNWLMPSSVIFTVETCWTIILLLTTTLFAAIKISCGNWLTPSSVIFTGPVEVCWTNYVAFNNNFVRCSRWLKSRVVIDSRQARLFLQDQWKHAGVVGPTSNTLTSLVIVLIDYEYTIVYEYFTPGVRVLSSTLLVAFWSVGNYVFGRLLTS